LPIKNKSGIGRSEEELITKCGNSGYLVASPISKMIIDLTEKNVGWNCNKIEDNKYQVSLQPIDGEELKIIMTLDQFYLTCLDIFSSLPEDKQDSIPTDPW